MVTPHLTETVVGLQNQPLHQENINLKLIVEGIASQVGEAFFQACAHYLAEVLQIQYALIAEFVEQEQPRARVLAILQHRLQANQTEPAIQVIKEYQPLPKVNCYASQLNQVFMNILNNAIDALRSDYENITPIIKIKTELLTSGEAVKISIIDNGMGVDDKNLPQLFDPFFTTKPVGSGTGLGLSISYQIVVEQHGGKLSCSSAPGQCAEFQIEIPI